MNTAVADLKLISAVQQLDSNPAAAADQAAAILAMVPAHAEAQLLLGAACRRIGDPGRAIAVLEALAAQHPQVPGTLLELGRAYAAAGRPAEAATAFGRAVEVDPGMLDAWRELAAQLFLAGDEKGGDEAYGYYERRMPQPAGFADAVGALNDERLDTAELLLNERLRQDPADIVALRLLASCASRRDRLAEAQRLLEKCLALAPGCATARFDLANVHYSAHRTDKALPLIERLLAADPDNLDYLMLKARTLRLVGGFEEAILVMQRIVVAHPGNDAAWLLLGHLRREVGQQAGAIEAYRRAIAARPESGEAYWSISNLKTVRFAPEDVAAMRALLERRSLASVDRVRLEFALGKALEDEAAYAESFEHYARANTLHRLSIGYDAAATHDDVERAMRVFGADFFRERAGWGSERADPIFIVGLPRSGSTLLEQMLASHPGVEGTRELPDLSIVAAELIVAADPAGGAAYPESAARMTRQALEAAAASYLERTQPHRVLGRPRFVDKMLGNFGHIGLIQLMFPNAAIIDARRHPMGTGLSCYKQLFVRGLNFTYDLGELGAYLRDYAALMDHFDRVLPGRVHRVHYEHLIADPEGELRRLLDYCRLPFDPACLRFYENPRIVQTASSEQVRRPLFAEGVDQWRHYEPWLGALKDALGDLIERYPAVPAVAR